MEKGDLILNLRANFLSKSIDSDSRLGLIQKVRFSRYPSAMPLNSKNFRTKILSLRYESEERSLLLLGREKKRESH